MCGDRGEQKQTNKIKEMCGGRERSLKHVSRDLRALGCQDGEGIARRTAGFASDVVFD